MYFQNKSPDFVTSGELSKYKGGGVQLWSTFKHTFAFEGQNVDFVVEMQNGTRATNNEE